MERLPGILRLKARKNKDIGIIKQVLDILEGSCRDNYEIEAALILRSSLFLNGILTNSEVWQGLKLDDEKQLEHTDEILNPKMYIYAVFRDWM